MWASGLSIVVPITRTRIAGASCRRKSRKDKGAGQQRHFSSLDRVHFQEPLFDFKEAPPGLQVMVVREEPWSNHGGTMEEGGVKEGANDTTAGLEGMVEMPS